MGQPTHPNATIRKRLQNAWTRAHKNTYAGYMAVEDDDVTSTREEAHGSALLGDVNSTYGDLQHPHADDGTVDRSVTAAWTDGDARDSGQRGNT